MARAPGGHKKIMLTKLGGGGGGQNISLFRLCPPSLVGAYYLQPPDARAIFLHNDLLCNGTCSLTGEPVAYWERGGHKRKRSEFE